MLVQQYNEEISNIELRSNTDKEKLYDESISSKMVGSNNEIETTLYDKITLKNINLDIKKGEFVAVIGEIGSGKSSLISSIIGYMLYIDKDIVYSYKDFQISNPSKSKAKSQTKDEFASDDQDLFDEVNKVVKKSTSKPDMKVTGTISLIEQNPWILNQTIRDNIIFGKRLIAEKYNETIEI